MGMIDQRSTRRPHTHMQRACLLTLALVIPACRLPDASVGSLENDGGTEGFAEEESGSDEWMQLCLDSYDAFAVCDEVFVGEGEYVSGCMESFQIYYGHSMVCGDYIHELYSCYVQAACDPNPDPEGACSSVMVPEGAMCP